jgi:hypothetical protein
MERAALIELSKHKPIPPFTLDESLTFYCPQENLEAFDHPIVTEWHNFMTTEYQPPVGDGRNMMLVLPCSKIKPYILSTEHLAVNRHLFSVGFDPADDMVVPEELYAHLPAGYDRSILNNGLLARDGLTVHRFVISEPMGLVPYELLYHYQGELSPASRYDDPGLFEHRPNTVCPWRDDYSGVQRGRHLGWGDNEKLAYVQVHNRLVELIAAILRRLTPHYERIVAYVSPRLTHRSFLASTEEKKASGLRTARRIAGKMYPLKSVNDSAPGTVAIVPSKEELQEVYRSVEARLRAQDPSITPVKAKGYIARGGGGATPLALPEALRTLENHLHP